MHIIIKMNLQLKLTQKDARCHLLKYMFLRKKSSPPKKTPTNIFIASFCKLSIFWKSSWQASNVFVHVYVYNQTQMEILQSQSSDEFSLTYLTIAVQQLRISKSDFYSVHPLSTYLHIIHIHICAQLQNTCESQFKSMGQRDAIAHPELVHRLNNEGFRVPSDSPAL